MAATPIQVGLPFDDPALLRAVARVIAFVLASVVVSALSALVYRWYAKERIPQGLATLLGVAIVALYLNTVGLFGQVVGGTDPGLFSLDVATFNIVSLLGAALVTPLGRRVGDAVATDVFAVAGARELDVEVSRLVKTVGRVTAVTLPETDDIGDIEGYDPVAAERKKAMGGKTLLFPRRLTVAELRDRLATRLKDDYNVGHVDVELDEKGAVTYLAVGSRAAGLGPTLGPGAVAVAVQADPGHGASAGDVVQVWQSSPSAERVVTGELRGVAGETATVAVDEAEATKLDAHTEYHLVTLPAEPQAEREFASLLRAADETMGAIYVRPESELAGRTVGSVDATVAAVRPASGPVEAIPSRERPLAADETLYVVARPETIRRLEAQAGGVTSDGAGR